MDLGNGLVVVQLCQAASPGCLLDKLGKGGLTGDLEEAATKKAAPKPVLVTSIERAVGPCPTDRTWQDEWVAMRIERMKLEGKNFDPATFQKGGVNGYDKVIKNATKSVQFKVDLGWGQADAEAYSAVVQGCSAAIATSIKEKSNRYAASVHMMTRVLAKAALTQAGKGTVAPDCYYHLRGQFGLANEDPAFRALEKSDAGPGTSFQTNGVVIAHGAKERFTSDGFGVSVNTGGKTSINVQKSPVLKFVSSKEDANGLHSMIHASPTPGFACPPMTTITVESVTPAGQWKGLNGVTVNQKLFTVSVSFAKSK